MVCVLLSCRLNTYVLWFPLPLLHYRKRQIQCLHYTASLMRPISASIASHVIFPLTRVLMKLSPHTHERDSHFLRLTSSGVSSRGHRGMTTPGRFYEWTPTWLTACQQSRWAETPAWGGEEPHSSPGPALVSHDFVDTQKQVAYPRKLYCYSLSWVAYTTVVSAVKINTTQTYKRHFYYKYTHLQKLQ